MHRAKQTAQIIADKLTFPITYCEEFRELNVGDLDGKREDSLWSTYNCVMKDWLYGANLEHSFPGGEDRLSALQRFYSGVRRVLENRPTEPTIVVGHGGLLIGTLSHLCPGINLDGKELRNCGLVTLSIKISEKSLTGRVLEWD